MPVWLAIVCLGGTWWYVTIYSQKGEDAPAAVSTVERSTAGTAAGGLQEPPAAGLQEPPGATGVQEPPGA
eukprot:gene15479-20970_t